MLTKSRVVRSALLATLAVGALGAFAGVVHATDRTPRIIGGQPASEHYSFATALYWDEGGNHRFHCSASLIDREWVATAAHCVFNGDENTPYDPTLFDVRIGSNDRTAGGSTADVVASYIHPDYLPQPEEGKHRPSDIALLRLDHPVSEQPVALGSADPAPGTSVRVLGWGITSPSQTEAEVDLRQLDTLVIPSEQCVVGGDQDLTEGDLCVDDPTHPTTGTCSGDSGAPVVRRVDGAWTLLALDSRSVGNGTGTDDGCGSTPSAMPSIPAHHAWISSVIAD